MAIINQRTGYYGFTYNPNATGIEDKNGSVNKVIFSIVYPLQDTEVELEISDGAEDWGAQMGDGTIIPLSNPVKLFQNRDSSIVEFSMNETFPSNSPCFLVYRSSTAKINIKEYKGTRSFVPNTISGNFAFTVEGYGGTTDSNGQVNRIMASIWFPLQTSDVEFTISDDPSHWGARMPDGNIINLRNPVVLTTNRDNAVVQFTMDSPYPSNSPCIIVYRTKDAKINIVPITGSSKFIPVTDITGVPTEIIAGYPIDLSGVTITPFNATIQGIDWTVESGPAVVNGSWLTATGGGSIVIRATIKEGGINGSNFTKTFNVRSRADMTIVSQPLSLTVVKGNINGHLETVASLTGGVLKYQWYRSPVNSNTAAGAVAVTGATSSSFLIPKDLTVGQWYYYCEISDAAGTISVKTNIAVVTVVVKVTGITVIPDDSNIATGGTLQLEAIVEPVDATNKKVVWKSSNESIAYVDQTGLVTSFGKAGNVRITATTEDGGLNASAFLHAQEYIPIEDIYGIPTTVKVGENIVLRPTITPSSATYQKVVWEVRSQLNTGAKIEDGLLNIPYLGDGAIIIRATVTDGKAIGVAYIKEFRINVELEHVPVTDILGIAEKGRAATALALTPVIVPSNATRQNVAWHVKYQSGTLSRIDGNILYATYAGKVTVEGVIVDGISVGRDFAKDFEIDIKGEFIPVERLMDLPTKIFINSNHKLEATIVPTNATNQDIEWSIVSAGNTGATLVGDTIYAVRVGTIRLRATIYCAFADGEYIDRKLVYVNPDSEEAKRDPMIVEFDAEVQRFVAVTDIRNVPTSFLLTERELVLSGDVYPSSATNQDIEWSIVSAGNTGATLVGNVLRATKEGTIKVRATIKRGKKEAGLSSTNFTKDFTITVQNGTVDVTDIIDLPTEAFTNVELELTGTVVPNNATNKSIQWIVSDANGTNAHVADDNIFICPTSKSGTGKFTTVKITATIKNGTRAGDFIKEFSMPVNYSSKKTQNAPEPFDVEFEFNEDNNTFKAIAPVLSGAEYSFDDGVSWSNINTITGVNYNEGVKVMIRFSETTTHYASPVTVGYGVAPKDTVKNPSFNPASRSFEGTLTIEVTCDTPGATIYYNTDGEKLSELNRVPYLGPIVINDDTTINACAIKDGMNDSEVVSSYYSKTN